MEPDFIDLKIRYVSPDVPRLKVIKQGDWVDVYTAESVTIKQNEMELVSLGFALQLPKGYEAHLLPRSSLFKNYGVILANGMGIIDESYCGDNDIWKMALVCIEPKDSYSASPDGMNWHDVYNTHIPKGERIGQFRIMKKQPLPNFIEVETLGNPNRGGFGSTGKN